MNSQVAWRTRPDLQTLRVRGWRDCTLETIGALHLRRKNSLEAWMAGQYQRPIKMISEGICLHLSQVMGKKVCRGSRPAFCLHQCLPADGGEFTWNQAEMRSVSRATGSSASASFGWYFPGRLGSKRATPASPWPRSPARQGSNEKFPPRRSPWQRLSRQCVTKSPRAVWGLY